MLNARCKCGIMLVLLMVDVTEVASSINFSVTYLCDEVELYCYGVFFLCYNNRADVCGSKSTS